MNLVLALFPKPGSQAHLVLQDTLRVVSERAGLGKTLAFSESARVSRVPRSARVFWQVSYALKYFGSFYGL